jgi:amino acid adenylation domain-containing protein
MLCSPHHTLPLDEINRNIACYSNYNIHGTSAELNETFKDYNLDVPIYRYFEEQARNKPFHPAVLFEGAKMSYQNLNNSANSLAAFLCAQGVHSNDVIAVIMDRSFEMVISLLGILKCGGAYLPVDPSLPIERIHYMLENAGVNIVLTHKNFYLLLDQISINIIKYDILKQEIENNFPAENLVPTPDKKNLAYVIYTSGSTGKPKACMLPHQALSNRLLWMQDRYPITADDRVLQKTPFSFDVSVWEFFWPLMAGATLVMAKPKGHKSPKYIIGIINRFNVTVCHFVPSMFNIFLSEPCSISCKSLRFVFTSGESLKYCLIQHFLNHFDCRLINLYGPTEAAIDVTYWECEKRKDEKVFIGKPIANTSILILDEQLRTVPRGEIGEIYIGGIGLAFGYLNNPKLTEQRFIPNPTTQVQSPILYKTGDLGKLNTDGNIEYHGRLDYQVKLRGLRIELGEIESLLMEMAGIKEAVVVVQELTNSNPRLVAYINAAPGIVSNEIKNYLARKLPEYSIPQFIVFMKALPISAHGKLDRNALPWPVGNNTSGYEPLSTSILEHNMHFEQGEYSAISVG